MRVLHAPTLGWRNVNLREALAAATGLPVQIENSGRACALAQAWACAKTSAAGRRPGVRQHLGRRRRRRDDSRRGAARPAQHRRRVRPPAAVARRSALLVRIERLLGSVRLESAPRWRATSAGRSGSTRPGRRRAAALHRRGSDRARARARCEGVGGARHHGPLSRPRPGVGRSTCSIPRASTSAAKSRWRGI